MDIPEQPAHLLLNISKQFGTNDMIALWQDIKGGVHDIDSESSLL